MKNLNVVVYSMEKCPFCIEFKEMLTKEGIEFFDRDIDKYEKEYNSFSELTKNDMVPALLIIEGDNDDYDSFLYVPEKDYSELKEALKIVQEHRKRVGLII